MSSMTTEVFSLACRPKTDPDYELVDGRTWEKKARSVRKRFTVERIIRVLREAEAHLSQGKSIRLVSREIAINEQTCHRCRKEYGGMRVSQARQFNELEQENTRLKRAVADLTLGKLMLLQALPSSCQALSGHPVGVRAQERSSKRSERFVPDLYASCTQIEGIRGIVRD